MVICPHCETAFGSVVITPITGNAGVKSWHCIAYSCPRCRKAISVAIDPIALNSDLTKVIQDSRRQ